MIGDFAYYTQFADAIRQLRKAGEPTETIESYFKEYVLAHPPHPEVLLEIKDLKIDFRLDLSWYPLPEQLLQPGNGEEEEVAK